VSPPKRNEAKAASRRVTNRTAFPLNAPSPGANPPLY
jgi:hypothetical protein